MAYQVYYLDYGGEPGEFVEEAPDYQRASEIAEKHAHDQEGYGAGILCPCGCWKWGPGPEMVSRCEEHELAKLIEAICQQADKAIKGWQRPWEIVFPDNGVIEVFGRIYYGGINAENLTGEEDVNELADEALERLHHKYHISDAAHEELRKNLVLAARQAIGWAAFNRQCARIAREATLIGLERIEEGWYADALSGFYTAAKMEAKFDGSLDYRELLEMAQQLYDRVAKDEDEEQEQEEREEEQ